MLRLGLVVLGIAVALPLRAQHLVKVEPSADGKNVRIQVFPAKEGTTGIIELLDARSGKCVKTLWAGPLGSGQALSLGKNPNLKPGSYRVRYRDGIGVAFDSEIPLPRKEKWLNPTDVAFTDKGIYVLDRGFPSKAPEKKEDGSMTEEIPAIGEFNLFRFTREGKPDTTFGDRGRASLYDKAARMESLAVDNEGLIYIPSGGHSVAVFGPTGDPMSQTIGGYDGDPFGPKCTTWVDNVAIGPGRTIYILTAYAYGTLRAYDRTKNAFEGILYSLKITGNGAAPRALTSDQEGNLYYLTGRHVLQKVEDNGKAFTETYSSSSSDKMYFPRGPSACAGLIWVVDHGPAGPFWDSGGDNNLLLYWDTGSEITLFSRFGGPGKAKDKVEFLNPTAVAQSPDHLELWVTEDGMPYPEGPNGNARVRKFKITAEHTEEVPLELK